MLCTVNNKSNRLRALTSATAGILAFIPPNSQDVYDLDHSNSTSNDPTLTIEALSFDEVLSFDEPLVAPAAIAETHVEKSPVVKPSVTKHPTVKLPEAGPEEWQKGLEVKK